MCVRVCGASLTTNLITMLIISHISNFTKCQTFLHGDLLLSDGNQITSEIDSLLHILNFKFKTEHSENENSRIKKKRCLRNIKKEKVKRR